MAYDDFEDKSFKVDENYFNVLIPDLDPGKDVPVQFRWQYDDNSYSAWSVSKILQVPQVNRPESTNIVAQWIVIDSGIALQITWTAPELANGFGVYLTKTGTTTTAIFSQSKDKNSADQKIIIPAQWIRDNFGGELVTNLTGVLKTIYIDTSTTGQNFVIPPYSDPLANSAINDADWTITAVDKGFSVSWKAIATSGTYWETVVYKSPTQNGTYVAVGSARNAPVIVEEINTVWVKIQHRLITGQYSLLSNAKQAAAYVPIVFDETPPNDVTVNSAGWSGYDLVINYTMPAQDPGKRFKVILQNGTSQGFFYDYFPATSGTHNYTITDDLIFKQFGQRFSSYTGTFISIDSSDNETAGVSFATTTMSNPGLGVTPTFTLTGITNGYTATWNPPAWATLTKVYEGTVSGFTPQESNIQYSGSSPAIVKTLGRPDPYGRKYIVIRWFGKINGHQSEFFSAEQFVDPIDSISADIQAPDAPATISATSTGVDESGSIGFNGFINLSWGAVSDSSLRGYRIRFRPYKAAAPFENYSYVDSPGTGTTYRISGLPVGAVYEIGIASYDEFNNTTSSYTNLSPNPTVQGTPFIADEVNVTGYFSANSGTETGEFRFGYGIETGKRGIKLTNSNYWYIDSDAAATFKVGGPTDNYIYWNGQKLEIDGDLGVAGGTTIGGNIAMANSGASIYAGTLNLSGNLSSDGFLLNSDGLAIKKGSVNLRLDTSDGGIYAEYGQIAGWKISTSSLQRGTGAVNDKYAGISSTGTYSFWAGSDSSGGDASAKFLVTPAGEVTARQINIIGSGSNSLKLIDAGSNFYIRQDGYLYAINAEIEGTVNASAGVFKGTVDVGTGTNPTGQLRISSSGGTILMGHGLTIEGSSAAGITATAAGGAINFWVRASDGYMFSQSGKIGGWTIGSSDLKAGGGTSTVGLSSTSTAGNYAFWAGATSGFDGTNYAPFSVTNTGILRATGAIISGQITVTSGRIGSQTTGWNINAAQLESYGTPAGSTQLILNSLTGEISGGKVSATKIVGSGFYLGSSDSATDKILSDGTFSLGGGKITYNGTTLTVQNSILKLGIVPDNNGTFSDSTVVQNINGELTTGRALHYQSNMYPGTNTARPEGYNAGVAFKTGDLWFTTKA